MSNRARTRRAARKARPSEAPSQAVTDVAAPAPVADAVSELLRTAAPDPPNAPHATETAQLRALEAGWDELLA